MNNELQLHMSKNVFYLLSKAITILNKLRHNNQYSKINSTIFQKIYNFYE